MLSSTMAVKAVKQEPLAETSNGKPPSPCQEDATMTDVGLITVPPHSFSLDNQSRFIQDHMKTEPLPTEDQPMDDIVIKQEMEEDAAEGWDYLEVDIKVSEDGAPEDDQKSVDTSDAETIVKMEEEKRLQNLPDTHINEQDCSISDTSQQTGSQQQARRLQRNQQETLQKHSMDETGHTCALCGKVFDQSLTYLRHMRHTHTGENPYTCNFCGKAFKNMRSFRRHKISHSNQRPFSCHLCQKSFKRKPDAQKHIATCHSNERPYSCDLCEKTFKRKSHVKLHLANCHSDERPYSCRLCEKSFKQKCHVEEHILTCHSNERPYSCNLCQKSFKRKANLQQHTAECHSDERPFSCDLCEKTFKRKSDAQKHITTCHSN